MTRQQGTLVPGEEGPSEEGAAGGKRRLEASGDESSKRRKKNRARAQSASDSDSDYNDWAPSTQQAAESEASSDEDSSPGLNESDACLDGFKRTYHSWEDFDAALAKFSQRTYQIFLVSGCGGKRSHARGPCVFRHYPENRRDESYSLLANVDEMRKSGAKTKGILFYLREMSDVQRAEAFLRDVYANDSGSRAYIYMDDDTIAEAVVFQMRKLRRLFSAFSDVMIVNMAFGTNRNRYKLFSFLVHNFNGKEQYVQHSCWQQKHEQI
ncbi:hypothetical protein GQ600_7283 [Phytophthora cactorum]|nr:hypothetical protein GQ600_7283 [Phytophthora cactorum]